MSKPKHPAAVALGRLGGSSRSAAKREAAKRNGAKGGRPKKLDAQLAKLWKRGKEAWKYVPNASKWVEELRGKYPDWEPPF